MRGELIEAADLGWHGIDGDRRLAFRRADDRLGFPWLTATKLPELILFAPQRTEPAAGGNLPTHVRTPEGQELGVFSPELAMDIGRRHGSPVEMMHLNRGIFDEASDSARQSAAVLKAIVRLRGNKAGVYATVTRRGQLAVGQSVFFEPAAEHPEGSRRAGDAV